MSYKFLGIYLVLPLCLFAKNNKRHGELVPSLLPLSTKVFSHNTFRSYIPTQKVSSNLVQWVDQGYSIQKPYKVSLVGVNINTWLENPEYFNDLKNQAREFSVKNLLDHLQSYNPDLIFNDPQVVSQALNKDIYSPYFQILSTPLKKIVQYSDTKATITFSKHYNIYGAASGNLPYFGRPVEGRCREIHLGTISSQLEEIAVKLPETDIFCVAMINIIPNWLEEGLDVLQINQQKLEILIYAFDRQGSLIGGAGIPSNVYHQKQQFIINQTLTSKVWQPGKHRKFYIIPRYILLNTVISESNTISSTVELPKVGKHNLTRNQRYILSVLKQRMYENKSLDVEIFSPEGVRLVPKVKIFQVSKARLAKRVLVHKNSFRLVKEEVDINSTLMRDKLLVRLDNKEEIRQKDKTMIKKMDFSSNEADKLNSLLNYGQEILVKDLVTYSNKLYYTNTVLPFETESDPALYQKHKKEYYILSYGVKKFKKEARVKVRQLVAEKKRYYLDKIFWYRMLGKRLQSQNECTEVIKKILDELSSIYKILVNVFPEKEFLLGQNEMMKKLQNHIHELEERNKELIITQRDSLEKQVEKIGFVKRCSVQMLEDSTAYLADKERNKHIKDINIKCNRLLEREKELQQELKIYLSRDIDYTKEIRGNHVYYIDITQVLKTEQKDIEYFAQLYEFPKTFIAVSFVKKEHSPMYRYIATRRYKDQIKNWCESRVLSYDGFVLGLTSKWRTKIELEDRLEKL